MQGLEDCLQGSEDRLQGLEDCLQGLEDSFRVKRVIDVLWLVRVLPIKEMCVLFVV